jgi:hypothetical protein
VTPPMIKAAYSFMLVVVTSRRVRRLIYPDADPPGVVTTRGEDKLDVRVPGGNWKRAEGLNCEVSIALCAEHRCKEERGTCSNESRGQE